MQIAKRHMKSYYVSTITVYLIKYRAKTGQYLIKANSIS